MSPIPVLCIVLVGSIAFYAQATDLPKAKQGILNVKAFNFSEQKVPLNGFWIYYDRKLLQPYEIDFTSSNFTNFPALWNDFRNSKKGVGFATYALRILMPPDSEPFALDIPQIYCSYKLWVNGEMVARNGVVAKSELESLPQWLPQTVKIESYDDTLNVVLQISNFQHHSGGIKEPIYLGAYSQLEQFRKWTVRGTLTEAITLAMIAIIFLFIYFKKGYKKAILYFFLLCFTWAIRTLFSNQFIFISFFPEFNWELMVKIEYLTLYFTMIWSILFLGRLFINDRSKIMIVLLVGGNMVFVAYTILNPALSFTRWLPAYLALSFILIMYGLLTVIIALLNKRSGVLSVALAVLLGLFIFGYDLLTYKGFFIYNALALNAGYITIFLLLGISLHRHLQSLNA
jgi:hypothetical protein